MARTPRQQRGIVAVLVAIGLLALLAMAGLAIDTGHLVLNKSRLQSTVDAAALAAAKVLDQTGSQTQATSAADGVFALNAAELSGVVSSPSITVRFSNTLNPFAEGSTPANYVRVRADNFSMWTSFTRVVGFDQLSTAASAVAGPSAPITQPCDLVPMTVCGDPAAGSPHWGFSHDNVTLLKLASLSAGSTIGPGNFQLISLGGSGANIVRQNLAGGYQGCVAGDTVLTQPGDEAGPVRQGLNTRFNQYQGGGINRTDYPPDKFITGQNPELDVAADDITVILKESGTPVTNISQLSYSYSDYERDYASGSPGLPFGKARRREVAIPIVDCAGSNQGRTDLPVLSFGCFFLLQPLTQKAGGKEGYVYAQLIGECSAAGAPGPVGGAGIYKIVLHNDPGSDDS